MLYASSKMGLLTAIASDIGLDVAKKVATPIAGTQVYFADGRAVRSVKSV